MNRTAKDFYKYLINEIALAGPGFAQNITRSLNEAWAKYEKTHCSSCGSKEVDIIITNEVLMKCRQCGVYTDLKLDNINPADYKEVTFVNEAKVRQILDKK